MWRRYYHVTHRDRVADIIEDGLDPLKARGKLKAVWLCSSARLTWAIAHVSANHDWPIIKLRVLSVHADPRNIKTWRWRGIYISTLSLPVYGLAQAMQIINLGPMTQPIKEM